LEGDHKVDPITMHNVPYFHTKLYRNCIEYLSLCTLIQSAILGMILLSCIIRNDRINTIPEMRRKKETIRQEEVIRL
jgi:hypothetical protein